MTLDDLRVFTAVVEAGSLGAAARQLGCTQSAVSQHLRRLEHECDMPLLERSAKGIALTPAGHVFYQATSAGLGALALALREIQRLRTGDTGRLAISTGGTTVRHFLRDSRAFSDTPPGGDAALRASELHDPLPGSGRPTTSRRGVYHDYRRTPWVRTAPGPGEPAPVAGAPR